MSPLEHPRLQGVVIEALSRALRVFPPPPNGTLPMYVSLGSVQLRCEAVAARLRPGSRAAYLTASVTPSRRLQIASPCTELLGGNRRAAPASARGTGRAAYTAIR